MKKSLLLLPLALVLAGCQNNQTGSDTDIPNAEPIDLGTEVQSADMPSSMNNSGLSIPPAPAVPTYTPPAQPSYTPPSYNPPQLAVQNTGNTGCQVVRDAANTPIYSQIQKGCYTGSQYTVAKGDTIFLIAYLTGSSVEQIARLNHLAQPYQLKLGQTLQVK